MIFNKTYLGVVEDNLDPKRLGRVKVRVMNVFDDIPLEDIPWANPWKDLNGSEFNVPEKGKVVLVVFDQGKQTHPEFIYSEHYNINLENKINKLSDTEYVNMKSLLFDHKTQIYVNDEEGLIIDHKYNNLNITDSGINLNLKDNNSKLNIGDSNANQQIILGNHFIEWFDKFLTSLQSGGLFNVGGPVITNPTLLRLITEFKAIKDIRFLSNHVNVVDNDKISFSQSREREDNPQYGDNWTSTIKENNITEKKSEDFKPIPGPNKEFDKPTGELSDEDIKKITKDIRNSTIGFGTREIQLIESLKLIKNKINFNKINSVYLKEYGVDIEYLINSELSGDDLKIAIEILNNLSEDSEPEVKILTDKEVEDISKKIKDSTDNWGTNETKLFLCLTSIETKDDWQKVLNYYNKQYGENIIDLINKELSGKELKKANDIINNYKILS